MLTAKALRNHATIAWFSMIQKDVIHIVSLKMEGAVLTGLPTLADNHLYHSTLFYVRRYGQSAIPMLSHALCICRTFPAMLFLFPHTVPLAFAKE